MELILRSAALALCTGFIVLLLRKNAPELGLTVSAVTTAVIFLAAVGFFRGLGDLTETVRESFGAEDSYTLPMMKCVGIALVTKISAELCRDASQNAAASAVELSGTACALGVVIPLLTTLMHTIGGLL